MNKLWLGYFLFIDINPCMVLVDWTQICISPLHIRAYQLLCCHGADRQSCGASLSWHRIASGINKHFPQSSCNQNDFLCQLKIVINDQESWFIISAMHNRHCEDELCCALPRLINKMNNEASRAVAASFVGKISRVPTLFSHLYPLPPHTHT